MIVDTIQHNNYRRFILKKQIALVSAGLVLAEGLTSIASVAGQGTPAEAAQEACHGRVGLYSVTNYHCGPIRHVNVVRGKHVSGSKAYRGQKSVQYVCDFNARSPYVKYV